MRIIVLSGEIDVMDVELALLADGIVVLETTRVGAMNVDQKVRDRLQQAGKLHAGEDYEEEDALLHLSIDVPLVLDGYPQVGWSDYLVYTKTFGSPIDAAKKYGIQAVAAWFSAGGIQDKFVYWTRGLDSVVPVAIRSIANKETRLYGRS
ncbi:hypothetical protein [Dyella sp. ASV21]|uniref:hypothetical protein n=1 Tax=Dyella sp. ASV21 TaxID=2795114 RepID=UPI0018EB5C34|nr:hypothetical protein [Dyella sp. ASV21]